MYANGGIHDALQPLSSTASTAFNTSERVSSHWRTKGLDDTGCWESDTGQNYNGIGEEGDDTFRAILASYPLELSLRSRITWRHAPAPCRASGARADGPSC